MSKYSCPYCWRDYQHEHGNNGAVITAVIPKSREKMVHSSSDNPCPIDGLTKPHFHIETGGTIHVETI